MESVAIFRELGDMHRGAYPLLFLALVLTYQDKPDLQVAFKLFRECIDLFRAAKDKWSEAYALTYLGDALLVPDDVVSARAVLERGLKLWREVGDELGNRYSSASSSAAWPGMPVTTRQRARNVRRRSICCGNIRISGDWRAA